MALVQRFTDFSEYAVGADLRNEDWTEPFDVFPSVEIIEEADEKLLKLAADGNVERKLLAWDELNIAAFEDIEILMRVQMRGTDQLRHNIMVRAFESNGVNALMLANRAHDNDLRIERYIENNFSALSGTAAFVTVADTWYWMRGHVIGDTLRMRYWADGDAEPSGWDREHVGVDGITAQGMSGIFNVGGEAGDLIISQLGAANQVNEAPSSPLAPVTGNISILGVTNAAGNPAAGATCYAVRVGVSNDPLTATTDANGDATIEGGEPGAEYRTWCELDDGSEVLTTQAIIRSAGE